jgi:hypothetical protein
MIFLSHWNTSSSVLAGISSPSPSSLKIFQSFNFLASFPLAFVSVSCWTAFNNFCWDSTLFQQSKQMMANRINLIFEVSGRVSFIPGNVFRKFSVGWFQGDDRAAGIIDVGKRIIQTWIPVVQQQQGAVFAEDKWIGNGRCEQAIRPSRYFLFSVNARAMRLFPDVSLFAMKDN